MSKTLLHSILALLLVAACATTPATSPVGVRVTALHQSDSRFAENVRKATVGALSHYPALPPGLTLTATVQDISGAPYPTTFVPTANSPHPVRSTGSDPQAEGAIPMVGGSSAGTAAETNYLQSAVVRGTYDITDASGRTLESEPLNVTAVNTPLGPPVSLARNTGQFLASRLAAVAQRSR